VEETPADPKFRTDLAWSVVGLANCRLDAGDPAGAVVLAGSVADLLSAGDPLYDAACICAKAAAVGSAPADRYGARAVELLRLAITRGYSDLANLLRDADLTAVRSRADFADL